LHFDAVSKLKNSALLYPAWKGISMFQIKPRQAIPPLSVPTLDGDTYELSAQKPEHFTLIVVYRGLHCPVCRSYMKELADLVPDFEKRGTSVLGLSTDDESRARQSHEQWQLEGLQLGYELPIETARRWGLFISAGKKGGKPGMEEPDYFAEPGVFLVQPDGTLYASIINTMPFARPHLQDVLAGVDFVIKNNYPARGEA
jgi:peroxiredoxin